MRSPLGPAKNTYLYHRWEDAPASLVQDRLVRLLRGAGQYRSVATLDSARAPAFVIRGSVLEFEEVDEPEIGGRVTLDVELYDPKVGRVLWTHRYSRLEPAGGKEVANVVEALERNLDRGLEEVISSLHVYFTANPPRGL